MNKFNFLSSFFTLFQLLFLNNSFIYINSKSFRYLISLCDIIYIEYTVSIYDINSLI